MKPTEIVSNLYLAFDRRDLGAIMSALSPRVKLRQSEQLPWGGDYTGPAGVGAFLGKLTQHLDSKVTIDRVIEAGETIVVIGWTEGKIRQSGAAFRVPVAHLWTLQQGKVTDVGFYIDHPRMLAVLGAHGTS